MARLFRNRARDRKTADARRDERMHGMKAEHWKRLPLRGIAPYAIDSVDGTYLVEFDRAGRSLPVGDWQTVWVRAYDVICPDGSTRRFPTLRLAKQFVSDAITTTGNPQERS